MAKVMRYTCLQCLLETRIVEGQDHRACACRAEYLVVEEYEGAQ